MAEQSHTSAALDDLRLRAREHLARTTRDQRTP